MFEIKIEASLLNEKEIRFLEHAYEHLLNHRGVDISKLSDEFLTQAVTYLGDGEDEDNQPFFFAATIMLAAVKGVPLGELHGMYEQLKDKTTEQERYESILAFALTCQWERMKRLGMLEDYSTEDPFDINARCSAKIPEEIFERARELCGDNPTIEKVAEHIDELMYASLHRQNRNN